MRYRDRSALVLATAGALWGAALTVGAFVVPVYREGAYFSDGRAFEHSWTLMHGASARSFVLAALPTIAGVVVWGSLHRVCTSGSRGALRLAWSVIAFGVAFSIVGAMTIGPYFWPMILLFTLAARRTPRPLRAGTV